MGFLPYQQKSKSQKGNMILRLIAVILINVRVSNITFKTFDALVVWCNLRCAYALENLQHIRQFE